MEIKHFLIGFALIFTLIANAKDVKAGRGIASYSDKEIFRNELEKNLKNKGINLNIANLRDGVVKSTQRNIPENSLCKFNEFDYWYAFGLDGGCGPNLGNMAGSTNANSWINYKIARCLNTPDSCVRKIQMELDGRNTCSGGSTPIDSNLAMSTARGTPSKTQTTPGNVCMNPTQLENMKNGFIDSFKNSAPPGQKLLEIHVGGYPGLNCGGGWAMTVVYGTCMNIPVPADPYSNPN